MTRQISVDPNPRRGRMADQAAKRLPVEYLGQPYVASATKASIAAVKSRLLDSHA